MRRQAEQIDDRRGDLFGDETESDFLVLMRAWKYAKRNGYDDELCRGMGIHAQAARQIGLLFEQFSSIAAAEGFDIREKPVAPEVSSRNGALTKVAASSLSVVEEVKRDLGKKSCSAN
jgi:hypothetical protein